MGRAVGRSAWAIDGRADDGDGGLGPTVVFNTDEGRFETEEGDVRDNGCCSLKFEADMCWIMWCGTRTTARNEDLSPVPAINQCLPAVD